MTYNPTADRTYWRGQDDARLIEAARDSNHELAIALGERLEDMEEYCEELYEKHERKGWGQSESEYIATISVMRSEIKALEAQIENLLYKGD